MNGKLTQSRQPWDVLKSEESQEADKHQEPFKSADEAQQRSALESDRLAFAASGGQRGLL